MKPRVWSTTAYTLARDDDGKVVRTNPRQVWVAEFDGWWEDFTNWRTALRYAIHVGHGGNSWDVCS